jgi:hypothetical protein
MFNKVCLFFFLFFASIFWAQNGFEIDKNKKKITIPFKFINNLIIIPVEVNGTKLNFLLDTGVSETLLFSLDETEQVKFEKIEKIKFSGFGNKEPFDGLKSSDNKVSINRNFVDNNHTIYIVLDQEINISSQVGFPINGIIGYHFFENHPIEIKYKRRKIIVYDTITSVPKKAIDNYTKFPISVEDDKPYIQSDIVLENKTSLDAKLLIDTGNSDALWLFKDKNPSIVIPPINYLDFLGKGFSGTIYGRRARLESFQLGKFYSNQRN